MNNKDQENGERTGPLIFTVPAYGFVMALYLDWLGCSIRDVSAKTARRNYPTTQPRTAKAFAAKVRNEAEESVSYQRGSRNPRSPDPLAFWRRYSA
jgi:hypothetical protein